MQDFPSKNHIKITANLRIKLLQTPQLQLDLKMALISISLMVMLALLAVLDQTFGLVISNMAFEVILNFNGFLMKLIF